MVGEEVNEKSNPGVRGLCGERDCGGWASGVLRGAEEEQSFF